MDSQGFARVKDEKLPASSKCPYFSKRFFLSLKLTAHAPHYNCLGRFSNAVHSCIFQAFLRLTRAEILLRVA